jgi:hypothetical protein
MFPWNWFVNYNITTGTIRWAGDVNPSIAIDAFISSNAL